MTSSRTPVSRAAGPTRPGGGTDSPALGALGDGGGAADVVAAGLSRSPPPVSVGGTDTAVVDVGVGRVAARCGGLPPAASRDMTAAISSTITAVSTRRRPLDKAGGSLPTTSSCTTMTFRPKTDLRRGR